MAQVIHNEILSLKSYLLQIELLFKQATSTSVENIETLITTLMSSGELHISFNRLHQKKSTYELVYILPNDPSKHLHVIPETDIAEIRRQALFYSSESLKNEKTDAATLKRTQEFSNLIRKMDDLVAEALALEADGHPNFQVWMFSIISFLE